MTTIRGVAQEVNAKLNGQMVKVGAQNVLAPRPLSSGFSALDEATGFGGFPRGRITELVGRPTSGRTTVAIQSAAEVEGFVAWVDVPGLVDVDRMSRQGVDLDRVFVIRPERPADALAITAQLVAGGNFDLVVFDSLPDVAAGGPTTRGVEQFMRVLVPRLARSATATIIMTAPEQHYDSLAYAAALRIAFSPTGMIRLGGVLRGWRSRATLLKAPGHQLAEVGLEVWI